MKEPKHFFIIYIPKVTSLLVVSDNKAKITAAYAMANGLNKLAHLGYNISDVQKININHPAPVPTTDGRIIDI